MKCVVCDGHMSRVILEVGVGKAIRDHVPHLMLVKCMECDRRFLVTRESPHVLAGTVKYRDKGNGVLGFTLFAAEGELMVFREELV